MSRAELSVEFTESQGIVVPLEVRSPDGAVSVEDLHAVLFALRVQVIRADEHVEDGRAVQRLAVCEFDGGPLRAPRKRAIVAGVASALGRAA
jgi:hypothetical protein